MNADEAPAGLQSNLGSGDAGQGKGGTQEFCTVDSLNRKKQVLLTPSNLKIYFFVSTTLFRATTKSSTEIP